MKKILIKESCFHKGEALEAGNVYKLDKDVANYLAAMGRGTCDEEEIAEFEANKKKKGKAGSASADGDTPPDDQK